MSEEPNPSRPGGLVPSQGIEWSFILLAIAILGMVFLFFQLLGKQTDEKPPAYDMDRQISPRPDRERREADEQPEIGAPVNTEST